MNVQDTLSDLESGTKTPETPETELESGTLDFSTLSVHAGQEKDTVTGARAVPIYATASYTFESAEHAASLFAGEAPGNQYGRMHNPTVDAFTKRLVALERGVAGVSLSSGQAATTATLLALARPGGHLVVSSECFGGTFAVLRKVLEPWGCEVSTVLPEPDAIQNAIRPETVGVWVETIANPSGSVPDIAAIADLCQGEKVPFVVDNTWGCGGYLCRPLTLGADVVVHSATKWIGGHGTFVGGAIVEAGRFDWAANPERFPAFIKPDSRGRTYVSRAPETAYPTRL